MSETNPGEKLALAWAGVERRRCRQDVRGHRPLGTPRDNRAVLCPYHLNRVEKASSIGAVRLSSGGFFAGTHRGPSRARLLWPAGLCRPAWSRLLIQSDDTRRCRQPLRPSAPWPFRRRSRSIPVPRVGVRLRRVGWRGLRGTSGEATYLASPQVVRRRSFNLEAIPCFTPNPCPLREATKLTRTQKLSSIRNWVADGADDSI